MKKGQRFGRLKALRRSHSDKKHVYWVFQCDCGNQKVYRASDVRKKYGASKSCGCLRRDNKTTHGLGHTRINNIWSGMLTRVRNAHCKGYKFYGGRGITVCRRWLVFKNFKDDMYDSYLDHVKKHGEKNTTLERIDLTKGYKPSNCRWATILEQAQNRSSNVKFKGETATKASLRLGGGKFLVSGRIKNGWDIEKAFTTPPLKKYKKK